MADQSKMKPRAEKLGTILSGSAKDLELIRAVKGKIGATSDRETVRRMAIFALTILEQQEAGNQVLLNKKTATSRRSSGLYDCHSLDNSDNPRG